MRWGSTFSGNLALCVVFVAACNAGLPSPHTAPTASQPATTVPTTRVSPSPAATATPTPIATVTVVPTLGPSEEPYASPYSEGRLKRYPFADAVQVAVGDGIACARRESGHIACWGYYDPGTGGLGDGVDIESVETEIPVHVSGIDDAVDIDVAYHHACVVRANGHVWCWGENRGGEIGDGTVVTRPVPVRVSGLRNAVQVAAGEGFSCARLEDGSVWCWGDPLGDEGTYGPVPVRIDGVDAARDIDASPHACVTVESGAVICWGWNLEGQVDPTTSAVEFAPPTHVDGIGGAVTISAGYSGTCALSGEGAITCWGAGGFERPFGRDATASVVSVGLGWCAVLNNHSIDCGGALTPAVNDAVDISVGTGGTNCAVLGDGAVVCWVVPQLN